MAEGALLYQIRSDWKESELESRSQFKGVDESWSVVEVGAERFLSYSIVPSYSYPGPSFR